MQYGLQVAEGLRLSRQLVDVLSEVPSYLDVGTPPGSEPERMLFQLVYQVNRQNFISLIATLESDHVIPAAMLARSLLEESIRWNWITTEPERATALFQSLRRSVRLITDECDRLSIDATPFVAPSPLFDVPPSGPPQGSLETRFPSFEQMLEESDALLRRAGIDWQVRDALYAQYRVLSQLAHTNVLGMIAVVQPASETDVSIGQKLSDPVAALVVHSAAASIAVILSHTVRAFVDNDFGSQRASGIVSRAMAIVTEMVDSLAPVHQLTP